jgi:beta-glucosidase-like glycosyl hydrolase
MAGPVVPVPPPGSRPEPFLTALLEAMSLAEKIGQLIGTLLPPVDAELPPGLLEMPPGVLAVPAMSAAESNRAVRRLQHELLTGSRLAIPALPVALAEPRGGPRFPPPLARAASWDPALVTRIARVAAAGSRAGGVLGQLAPAVTLAAGPAPTRMATCFGGAPALAADLVAAHVLGAQGPDPERIDARHVAAAATGFGGLGWSPDAAVMTDLDARTLRGEVLAPAEAAVRAGVAMVVPTHGGNDGLPAHVDNALLRTMLRDEWEFGGPVIAAPGAVAALVHRHRVAEDVDVAREMVWESGVDASLMATDPAARGRRIAGMVHRGALPAWLIDEAVAALLRLKWRLGLWADPYPPPVPTRVTAAHELVEEAATESIVLLGDPRGLLPLRPAAELAVWGAGAALARSLDAVLTGTAVRHHGAGDPPAGAGPVVALLGDDAPAGGLRQVVRAALDGRSCVALLSHAHVDDVDELLAAGAAVLLCWDAVAEQADAVATVLAGVVEPGGRLPAPLTGPDGALPLGHGTGYTSFAYSDLRIPERLPAGSDPLEVRCRVTNTGDRAGKEVVQVYLRDRQASVLTPERALGGFAAVRLPAGGSVEVAVRVPAERFAVWDRAMRRVVEPGGFDVLVGRSAADIRLSGGTTAPAC